MSVVWNTDIDEYSFFTIDSVDAPNKGTTAGIRRSNFPDATNSEARFIHPVRAGGVGPVHVGVSWFPNNNATGDIRWRLRYSFIPFGSGVVSPSNNVVEIQPSPGVQNQLTLQLFEIPESAIPGSGQLSIHVQRRGSAGSDTYTGTARVVGFCYRRNRIPKKQ